MTSLLNPSGLFPLSSTLRLDVLAMRKLNGVVYGLLVAALWMPLAVGTRTAKAQSEPQEEERVPALAWFADEADPSELDETWRLQGSVKLGQPGPRPREFPAFAADNRAVTLGGKGARIEIPDDGEQSRFDFANGDAITIEAWVKVPASVAEAARRTGGGTPMYVVGKGRTNNPGVAKDNQNWALRVTTTGGVARAGFLFATSAGGGTRWHRWTSELGFLPDSGWRHLAVSYVFGDPKSIRGWIDGKPTAGVWDLNGETTAAPVVDNDDVWIGSSMGGSAGNSFVGSIDQLAIHRATLSDVEAAARFARLGGPRVVGPRPEVMPEIGVIPPGKVLVTWTENLPSHDRWLHEGETLEAETQRSFQDAMLLAHVPTKYDAWGIRAAWRPPVLLRIAADLELPSGKQKLLLRARALGRLWIDGQLVARTKPITKQPPNGEEPITPLVKPLRPGMRVPGYHQQQVVFDVELDPSRETHRVVLELAVGGKQLRTETGECCLAIDPGEGKPFEVLTARGERLPLTNASLEPVLSRYERAARLADDRRRRALATSMDDFWQRRHAEARRWAEAHPVAIPNTQHENPIDAFLQAKIDRAMKLATGESRKVAEHFHSEVAPILREHCFRCHGEKDKGGLKLNSRRGLLAPDDSREAVVVPGNADASELMARIRSREEGVRMPPTEVGLSDKEIATLEKWINDGAAWPPKLVTSEQVAWAPVVSDEAFLRRVYLDTVGSPPRLEEARAFLQSDAEDKRERLIDQLLADPRWADHWVSCWLDLLAENPTLLNASLNSTGPFRWFVHDSLRDGKAWDRLVTELLLMRGGIHEGGSAGFGVAAENDAPFAAKGHIVASAFLGIELQCARCHDSPYHTTTQRDLYSLAAMLENKRVTVPATSRVPVAFFEATKTREPLIQATLKPNEPVTPAWPFAKATGIEDGPNIDARMLEPSDTRERLAALITSPENERFARVMVNRLWQRLMGAGLVEPIHDWEGRDASHPELLRWLARQWVAHGYDSRMLIRQIMTSQAYQRAAIGQNRLASSESRFFRAPDRRRLTAEQIVDSLHVATGSPMDVEELTFVHDGRRALSNRLSLGRATRAWMLGDLKNERDRPSLSLPRARVVVDVLEAFGWTGARQMPVNQRELEPNVLQPGILSNGTLVATLTRAAHESELAGWAVTADSPDKLVNDLFLRVLSRRPAASERAEFVRALSEGFESRLVPEAEQVAPVPSEPLPLVTWFNHLRPDANTIQQEHERRVRRGPPVDPRLRPAWREVYEDFVWSLINHREFVWVP